MKKGLRILIGAFLVLCTFPMVANAEGDKLSTMVGIRVNGNTVKLDSQSKTKILDTVNKYLGQESVVLQPRKMIQPIRYSWKIGKLNNPKANLSEMIRVVVDGKPVMDSQVRAKLTSKVMQEVKASKHVEIMPRAVYEKMNIVKENVQEIIKLAKKGRVPGSRNLSIDSTLEDVSQIYQYSHTKVAGAILHTTRICYENKDVEGSDIDFVYSSDQKVIQLSTNVEKELEVFITDHDLFKALGRPQKTTKKSIEELQNLFYGFRKYDDKEGLSPDTKLSPVYTYKAGNYQVHIAKADHFRTGCNEMFAISVDKNGESLK